MKGKDMINIELCGNRKVYDGMLMSLLSIIKNTNEELNVYVLTMDLHELDERFVPITDEQIETLNKVVKTKNELSKVQKIDITKKFKSEMLHFIKINKAPFEVLPDFITSKNIVDLCFLFIMTGIDDEDIVEDSQEIAKMLLKVDGKLQGVAHKIYEVFYKEEHRKMSEYSYEYFLKMIVL